MKPLRPMTALFCHLFLSVARVILSIFFCCWKGIWIMTLELAQWSRLIMPTLFKWSRGSTDFFSSFRYTFMHYFLYRIGLCFAFFHLKCTETKMAEKLNNFEKVERKNSNFSPVLNPETFWWLARCLRPLIYRFGC